MGKTTWKHLVAAAILVLIAGAVLVSAEEKRIEVKVEKDGDQEIMVDVDGHAEVITIDDLAEGESRTFSAGDHEIVVTRVGDELTLTAEGLTLPNLGGGDDVDDIMVWVGDDGENVEIRKEKVIIIKGDGESSQHAYTYHITGDDMTADGDVTVDIEEILGEAGGEGHAAIFIDKDGGEHHPTIVKHFGDPGMVRYRCEETGSVLMVKKDDAIEDVYICPATGCVMEKVDEPQVKVMKVRVETDED